MVSVSQMTRLEGQQPAPQQRNSKGFHSVSRILARCTGCPTLLLLHIQCFQFVCVSRVCSTTCRRCDESTDVQAKLLPSDFRNRLREFRCHGPEVGNVERIGQPNLELKMGLTGFLSRALS